MPLQATSGAASYDAFGGGVPVVPNYIEDVFSTYLYTGTGAAQTITNGIDLSTFGGLVWLKYRSGAAGSIYHHLYDSARGKSGNASYNYIYSNQPDPQGTGAYGPTSFNTNGFTLNTYLTESTIPYVSWTFRKQPKFFDVMTWTGTGSNRTISHNLGSVPACIMVKRTDTSGDWQVYHSSLANTEYLVLNTTAAKATGTTRWNSTTPTSTVFSIGTDATVNASGGTYVAYVFAHDAGGFGLTGTDNVISCGGYTGTGGTVSVNLGYEPQWVLMKRTDSSTAGHWILIDTMRGFTAPPTFENYLRANVDAAEGSGGYWSGNLSSTGFSFGTYSGASYIYIAIRKGPMKLPTSSTSVFRPMVIPINSASATTPINAGLTTDMVFGSHNSDESGSKWFASRLTGNYRLNSTSTAAEALGEYYWDNMVGVRQQETNAQPTWYFFKRSPSFFDEVCYTGNNVSGRTITHNLAAVPELMIVKSRTSTTRDWMVYDATNSATNAMNLNNDSVTSSSSVWASTAPTSTVFTVSDSSSVNDPAQNYVAYLFATCAGVSKVFSYTGNGSSQTINCGFTGGARFVLIKRTNAAGDWYVWDTARGIVSGNDPHLSLNSTAAEVTSNDTIDTDSTGFVVNQVSATNVNVSSATYIGLAIA